VGVFAGMSRGTGHKGLAVESGVQVGWQVREKPLNWQLPIVIVS